MCSIHFFKRSYEKVYGTFQVDDPDELLAEDDWSAVLPQEVSENNATNSIGHKVKWLDTREGIFVLLIVKWRVTLYLIIDEKYYNPSSPPPMFNIYQDPPPWDFEQEAYRFKDKMVGNRYFLFTSNGMGTMNITSKKLDIFPL